MKKKLLYFLFTLTLLFSCKSQLYYALYGKANKPSAKYPNMILIESNRWEYQCRNVQFTAIGGFRISQYEITNAQYVFFLNEMRDSVSFTSQPLSYFIVSDGTISKNDRQEYVVKKGYENHPVVNITVLGAQRYCQWLTDKANAEFQEKKKYLKVKTKIRIPSEAEWYYAAGIDSNHTLHDIAWYKVNSSSTQNAGLKKPNNYGLYDMYGNAAEWCEPYVESGWFEMYISESVPYAEAGGSFLSDSTQLKLSPCNAIELEPDSTYRHVGFRVVQTYLGKSSGYEF